VGNSAHGVLHAFGNASQERDNLNFLNAVFLRSVHRVRRSRSHGPSPAKDRVEIAM
jgi:hypothetical protein